MCGIFGWTGVAGAERLEEISALLRYRGPDAAGSWSDDGVSLGHRRLSIIDLSASSNQPFRPDPGYVLTYNGEIFNYRELRGPLEGSFPFRTHSDTEVLYYALIKDGMAALNSFNGFFAFAFLDRKRRKLFLVRDRYGVKPLYYAERGGKLVFASEQKAVFRLVPPEVDPVGLREYFTYKYVAGAGTLARGVSELPPGHYLEHDLDTGASVLRRWYEFPRTRDLSTARLDEELEELLLSAVKYRLISDVPVGLQLSGGVDSSIIARMVRDLGQKLNSYSISFPGSAHDEEPFSRRVAESLGLRHTAIPFTEDDFTDSWETAAYHSDEPVNHPHTLPILKLTKIAARDVTVLLSGEGADEAFLGYEQYFARLRAGTPEEIIGATAFNSPASAARLLGDDVVAPEARDRRRREILDEYAGAENLVSIYEFQTHLKNLLNRIDKMSMANSLEVRTPFLDYRLVERGLREKEANLLSEGPSGRERKKPLMRIYERYFGDGGSRRPKVGFRVPFDEWLLRGGRAKEFTLAAVASARADETLKRSGVERLLDALRGAPSPETIREAWTVANYALWRKAFFSSRIQ